MFRTLQSLRFFFVMLVVTCHLLAPHFDFGGECGVAFFFMLSGFVLAHSYGKRIEYGSYSSGQFLKNQWLKFYPLHIVLLVLTIALDSRLGQFHDWKSIIASVLLIQAWIPGVNWNFAGNGVAWFLSDMWFFYILFPWLYRRLNILSLTKLLFVGFVLIVGYVLLSISLSQTWAVSILYVSPFVRIVDFSIGILLFRWFRALELNPNYSGKQWTIRKSVFIEIGVIMLLITAYVLRNALPDALCYAALYWLLIPGIVFLMVLADCYGVGPLCRLLKGQLMPMLGGLAFTVYLTHMLTLRLTNSLLQHLSPHLFDGHTVLRFTLYVIVILAVATMVKKCFVDVVYHKTS